MSSVVVCHRVDRATRVMRWVRRLGMAFLLALAGLTLGGVAAAYWTGGGAGVGHAATATVSTPTGVSATTGVGSDTVAVSWGASTLSTGDAVTGYYVTRTPAGGGATSAACETSPAVLTAQLSCQDKAVADGSYTYVVTAVVGSWTAPSSPSAQVTVFTKIPPTVSASTSPAPNTNGYNSTSPVTVTLTATDPDGVARITYSVNSGAPVEVVPPAAATFPLSDNGEYTVTYSAVDTRGNKSPDATHVVRIDTMPPAPPGPLVMTDETDSGVKGDGITNVARPSFNGTAEPESSVTFHYGSYVLGPWPVGADGKYDVTVPETLALPDGSYSFDIRVRDPAGNLSGVRLASFVLDRRADGPSPPTLTTDSGRSSTDGITNDSTPTLSGSVTELAGRTEKIELYEGNSLIGTTTPASSSYEFNLSSKSDGSYSYTVKLFDVAGNVSTLSLPRSVTIDTAAPTAPTAPTLASGNDTGASSTDRITNISTPTLTGTTEASAEVKLFSGATPRGTQTTSSTTYSVRASTLADANHTLTVTATDAAGNVSASSVATQITVDTTAPTAPSAPVLDPTSNSGSAGDRITNDTTPTFTGTALAGTNVRLHTGNSPTGATVVAGAGGAWTATTGVLAAGPHDITARTDPDTAGNVGISPVTTVTIDAAAPAAPSAPVLEAASDSGISSDDGVTNVVTLTVVGSAEPSADVVLRADDRQLDTRTTRTGTYSVTLTLTKGDHELTATATDKAGNQGQASPTSTITIDTTAPAAPSAPVLVEGGASSDDGFTNDGTPTFTGTAPTGGKVTIFDGATPIGSVEAEGETWTVTTRALGKGERKITARTQPDRAGNVGISPPVTVTRNTAAPEVSIVKLERGPRRSVRVVGNASNGPGDTRKVTVVLCRTKADPCAGDDTRARLTTTIEAGPGTWSVTSGGLTGARVLYARAYVVDRTGNRDRTGAVRIVLEATGPAGDRRPRTDKDDRGRWFGHEVGGNWPDSPTAWTSAAQRWFGERLPGRKR